MPQPPPIILPVSEESISELGKVSGFAIAISMVAITISLIICPLLVITYWVLEALNSRIHGYRFSFLPWKSHILVIDQQQTTELEDHGNS